MKKSIVAGIIFTLTVILTFAVFITFNETKKVEAVNVDYYSELPEIPENMFIVVREVRTGQYPDMCDLPEEYWKRPEFYPRWDENKIIFYDHHDYSTWGVHGYGTYPADISYGLKNVKEGDSITFCTFFKTGWNIETYQGVRLIPIENEYWDVVLKPENILLKPAFPIFDKDWVNKIEVEIIAKQDIPKGTYNLGFKTTEPNAKVDKQFKWEVLSLELKNNTYLKECLLNIEEEKFLNNDSCYKYYQQRMNKYVTGGDWTIGRNTYNLEVQVFE